MATLINYDSSTFKQSKPNKRRLQDWQHSEARAHAARVAYWRTRESPSAAVAHANGASRDRARNDGPVNALPTPSTSSRETSVESGGHVKLRRADKNKSEQSDTPTDPSSQDQGATPQSVRTGSGQSEALTISSNRSPRSGGSPWSLGQSGGSFVFTQEGHQTWADVAGYTRLARHPSSGLFDPLDTLPSRQGNDVVASMNHCKVNVDYCTQVADTLQFSTPGRRRKGLA